MSWIPVPQRSGGEGADGGELEPDTSSETDTPSGTSDGSTLSSTTGAPVAEDDPTGYDVSAGAMAAPGEERSLARSGPVEPEDIALFVPRAILFVPKLVLMGVFWPLRELMRIADRHAIIAHIEELIYWNDEHTLGLAPMFSLQSRFGFTIGLNLFHNDLLGYGEELHLTARFGGRYRQAYELSFEGARVAGSRLWLEAHARFEENPSLFFAGLGVTDQHAIGTGVDPRAATAETYYQEQRLLGLIRAGVTLGRRGGQVQLGGSAIFNRRSFGDNDSGRRATSAVFDTATLPGFDDDVDTIELGGVMVIDTRDHHGVDARGVYLELFGGYVPPVNGYSYLHYGGEFVWAINLFRGNRLLMLRAGLEAVHGEDEEIPFTDLPRLGGADRLRGYGAGRFRDRLAAFGTAEYRYPIHRNLRGSAFLDVGHAARSYGRLFDDVRFGGGGGVILGSADSISFRLDLSYGEDFNVFLSTDLASAFRNRGQHL